MRCGKNGKRRERRTVANSRDQILGRLRIARKPFQEISTPEHYFPMVPLHDKTPAALVQRFVKEAEKLSCIVHQVANKQHALGTLLKIVDKDKAVSCWDEQHLPLPNLHTLLRSNGISISSPEDATVRVGITGANAALAATGSLVLCSGKGRYRATSLLPFVHVAIIRQEHILPDLESWIAQLRSTDLSALRSSSNIVLISGPSRTADIAMEIVMGMHGPREVHVILLSARIER